MKAAFITNRSSGREAGQRFSGVQRARRLTQSLW